MDIYIFLIIWSLFSASVCFFMLPSTVQLKREIYLYLNFIPLLIVSAFRNIHVGADTVPYADYFDMIKMFSFENLDSLSEVNALIYFESGYVFYNKVISLISDDSRILFFVTSLITLGGFIYFIYKNSYNVWISMFLFLSTCSYFSSMNIMRQYIAIMIICNSYYYLKKNNKVICFFLIIGASLFHRTAIIFLPYIFLGKINFKKFVWGSMLLFFGFLILMFMNIDFLIEASKYSNYLGSQYMTSNSIGLGVLTSGGFIGLIIVALYFMKFSKNDTDLENETYYLCIFVLSFLLIHILQYKIMILIRIEEYFIPFLYLFFPFVIERTGKCKYLLYSILIFYYFIRCYFYLSRDSFGILPYEINFKL